MPKIKKKIETPKAKPKAVKKVETPKETPPVEVATEESQAKKEFRAFIEKYKEINPKKYELKKAALENKLNSL